MWYTYYKKLRHTIDKCQKLHGKPQAESKGGSSKQKRHEQAYVANTQQVAETDSTDLLTTEFNKKEITKLRQLIGSLEKAIGSYICTFAYLGISSLSHALNASNTTLSSDWIIDSGATDHMTCSSQIFFIYRLF